jgi:hypothetical protein
MSDPGSNKHDQNLPLDANGHYSGGVDDLHDLMPNAAADEDDPLAAMRDDPNFGALIRDLQLIADEARRLFEPAAETPSDAVWEKIRKELPTKSTDA